MPDSRLIPATATRPSTPPVALGPDEPAAVVSLQARLIERALEAGASDLHIEPFPDRLRLRLRIDGWLHELDPLPAWMHASLVSRFKVTATMDVTERRRPQDGRHLFRSAGGVEVDLRIATAATQHGEKVTVRLLPRSRRPPGLDELGLDRRRMRRIESFVARPHGLILAAGPTGSGKTTTLHALLRRIDAVSRSIVTLEDPIEYTLPGAAQIPVRPSIGVDFAAALRAILRHDPDVILLGEIRDEETARVAVRSASTGHLVLSSVHANSAADSVYRLLDLGLPPYMVAATLAGVVSQRLVRRLCRRCRVRRRPPRSETERLGLPPAAAHDRLFDAVGCGTCHGGFDGRVGIFETLTLGPALRRLLGTDGATALESAATENGSLLSLIDSAERAWRRGATTLDELARVLPPAGG